MKAFTQIPPGTQILIGRSAKRRRALERAICSVFEGWSYVNRASYQTKRSEVLKFVEVLDRITSCVSST